MKFAKTHPALALFLLAFTVRAAVAAVTEFKPIFPPYYYTDAVNADKMAAEILDLVKDVWSRGTTVLLATHQIRVAVQLKRRTLSLEGGRLVKDEG